MVSQKFYALKVIDKKFIVQNNKEDIILNEREIMINTKHPFIVKLDYAFQSVNNLFILNNKIEKLFGVCD